MAKSLGSANFHNSASRPIATALHKKILEAKNKGLNSLSFDTTRFFAYRKNATDILLEVFRWLNIKCNCKIIQTEQNIYTIKW